ncbi:hypothetical protein B0O41_2695 [Propionibacteriaceae bacterium ES.041]|nr:hypothetical protein B0O41_2695 [Propionibacteriaceae bacterium ES.041]
MSEPQPGEWPAYSAYRADDRSEDVVSDPPRRKPGSVLAWILLFHLTIIGWTVGYLRGAPGMPIWLLVIGLIATVAAALCLDSLWVPRSGRVRGTIKRSKGSKSFGAAALMVMVLAPPAMLSMCLSSLYTLTVMRPTEATVLSAERVKSGKYNYTWQATVDLGDGRPHQVRLGSSRPELNERVTVRTDPPGFAAPRGNTEGPIDVAGPVVLGLPGLIFGWYVVIRHLRRTRPVPSFHTP